MNITAISVSHENAPIYVRERLSFTKRKQAEILEYIKQNIADEAVILSTCNRCELYIAGGDVKRLLAYLMQLSGSDIEPYVTVYEDEECVKHLMLTATGLKSMLLGEDQILGQVKDAQLFAREHKTMGKYLNTLFRLAVTGSKRVKTETLLSKTPVSAATISLKLCQNVLGTLKGKTVLIIGASGKTGNAVLKNMVSSGGVSIYATTRRKNGGYDAFDDAQAIDYDSRYDILDKCDAVISATLSPHLTLTADKISKALTTEKKRIFIDLAVPRDIEVAESELTVYKNVDDLHEIAENNTRIKLDEVEKAKKMLGEYEERFWHWKRISEDVEHEH